MASDVISVFCLPMPAASRRNASRACRAFLRQLLAGRNLASSVSHTDGMSVIAVCAGRRVGIDIERRRAVDVAAIEDAFFAGSRQADFFAAWTRNEALVKATGQGLVFPADVEVPGAEGMRVETLDVGPAYVTSLAADGPAWRTTVTFIGRDATC